jgi:hypothetical protein
MTSNDKGKAGWEEDYIPIHRDETAMNGASCAGVGQDGRTSNYNYNSNCKSRSLRDDKLEKQQQLQMIERFDGVC